MKMENRRQGLFAIFGNTPNLSKETPKVKRVSHLGAFVGATNFLLISFAELLVSQGSFRYLFRPCSN